MAPNYLKSVDDIPMAWRRALAAVHVAYPEAIIAGGALRDREHGVKVKDLDIFVSSHSNASMEQARNVYAELRKSGWVDIDIDMEKTYTSSDRIISGVLNAKFPGAPPVQIIVGTWAMSSVVPEIDFGICQISFDGKEIRRSRDYVEDAARRQFRLIPKVDDQGFVRSLTRWARLKEKYPDWKLHLGSRAETPYAHSGGVVTGRIAYGKGPNMWQAPKDSASMLTYLPSNPMQPMINPGEYVIPNRMADRILKETTAQAIRHDPINLRTTIKIDDRAAIPAAKIVQEMIDESDRLKSFYSTPLGTTYKP